MHLWHGKLPDNNDHPLHHVDIAIAASAGDKVIQNLAKRDTQLLTTDQTHPVKAIQAFLKQGSGMNLADDEQTCLDPEKRQSRSDEE